VGGDWLAIRVCEELLATHGHRAAVVWMHESRARSSRRQTSTRLTSSSRSVRARNTPAEEPQPPPEDCVPLGVWRNGAFRHIDAFEESKPFDRVLFLVPLKTALVESKEA
jgi:hypothetical protein